MEPDVSIETCSMIRIAVIPIGSINPTHFRQYVAMLGCHNTMELSSISSFYTQGNKSPFSQQPWDSGNLRFKFVIGGSQPSPWEDFQSYRKIHGVIGICHCPSSPDLDSVVVQFGIACKQYTSALVQRCFAFFPADSQLENERKKGNKLVLFPPADQRTQELHLQTMMQEIAASLLMEFEKWVLQAESGGTLLKTPLDTQASLSAEEVFALAIKAKKRRNARAQKTIGDYCLLAGSPIDANTHYSTALDLCRMTGDYFWYAGALEGGVCAFLMGKAGEKDPSLVQEVKYRYSGVIMHYRKLCIQETSPRVSPASFELEATLKLARFICRSEMVTEVVNLLTNASDGAKSLIDANDKLILYVEIARLFGALGYERKAAFYSRQVAQLYLQQQNNLSASSALQVLALTTKAYRVQSRASVTQTNETGFGNGKMHDELVVSLFESQWNTLQMVVLKEILLCAVRAGDPLAAWSAAARLVRSYYPLITPPGQKGLASALHNSSVRLPSGTHCPDPALPFIRLHSFPFHSSQTDIIKRTSKREDWWAGSAPSGPFIYTPFSKKDIVCTTKLDLIWVIGEPVQVLVELANPCGFDLTVNSISLSVHSGNFDAFPVSVTLPSNSSKILSLSGVPTKVGPVIIPGCTVHCFGVLTEHLFKDVNNLVMGAAQGLVLCDPFSRCGLRKVKNVNVPSVMVIPRLPLLVSRIIGGDNAIILYEGEIREIWISLANAGTVSVEQVHISLSGKNQDSVVSIGYEILKRALPLRPGAEVIIPVTLKAWQLSSENDTGYKSLSLSPLKQNKDGNSPVLFIYYAGPTGNELQVDDDVLPPGRRLVTPLNICVLQGLSFMKARLLSMEIPALVGEISENVLDTKPDRLMKIDPYRGCWGLRFLEFELHNPTDVVFEVSVSVQLDNSNTNTKSSSELDEFTYPKTRIDREYTSRVLIPLEHFKLPVLDSSILINDSKSKSGVVKTKAELSACIRDLITKIKVRWHSGRNSSGELHIKDATQAALQTSVMDVLLPDPLTFGFRLAKSLLRGVDSPSTKGSVLANDMTPMEVLVRNNTKDSIKLSLSITCRDVAGENCIDGKNPTVLWAGTLLGVKVEIPPLEEIKHSFSLYFLVPGEYTLLAAAVIHDPNDILRTRARATSPDEPIFCRGPPYHVRVHGTV
ncbi:trafficking protein particle complex II-specific subunit 120 homolog [Rutidosis leptorrhynchoides]|uniref:trafficking protein particle complex II-specific subunit 120 homolog n=1 Tax=Rutidosis leptorrhynchoides TaxID=125765 RepID=UPI003A99DEDC